MRRNAITKQIGQLTVRIAEVAVEQRIHRVIIGRAKSENDSEKAVILLVSFVSPGILDAGLLQRALLEFTQPVFKILADISRDDIH